MVSAAPFDSRTSCQNKNARTFFSLIVVSASLAGDSRGHEPHGVGKPGGRGSRLPAPRCNWNSHSGVIIQRRQSEQLRRATLG